MTCKQCGVETENLGTDGRCSLCHATDREYNIGDKVEFGENIGHINAIRITQGNCRTYECGYFVEGNYYNVELYSYEMKHVGVSNSIGFRKVTDD